MGRRVIFFVRVMLHYLKFYWPGILFRLLLLSWSVFQGHPWWTLLFLCWCAIDILWLRRHYDDMKALVRSILKEGKR